MLGCNHYMASFIKVSERLFQELGEKFLQKIYHASSHCRRFWSLFGLSPRVCEVVWNSLGSQVPKDAKLEYILWALLFLKVYATEHVNSSMANCDEKTFRKWSWTFVKLIAELPVIKWENRLTHDGLIRANASVDGTDCSIMEPTPFSPIWYSHKFKGPGLRYEVGTSIAKGDIVWVHGPFPCGSYPDLRIFRSEMKQSLKENELVIADGGYPDESCTTPSKIDNASRTEFGRIRARQETANRRLKQFYIVSHRFRHNINLHSYCFHAVANFTQLMIEVEEPLFDL